MTKTLRITSKRTIRTNSWHAVSVNVERNYPIDNDYLLEIRINSDPASPASSAYLTPSKARDVARALIDAAKKVEAFDRKVRR